MIPDRYRLDLDDILRLIRSIQHAGTTDLPAGTREFFDLPTSVRPDAGSTVEHLADVVSRATGGAPHDIVFRTSGTTGEPVRIRKPFALLAQEIDFLQTAVGSRRRVVSVVPTHHIYGFLFSVLLPKALDCAVLSLPSLPTAELTEAFRPGDLIIGFPFFWKNLAALERRFPADVHCVTSTGPCPPEVVERLARQGAARVIEVFGSSETGGLGWRDDHAGPFELFSYWHVESGELIRRLPDGLPERFPMPDVLQWSDGRRFLPGGRHDKAVQVGGINVYPARVAAVLKEHPLVADCTIRLMRPDEGERLKAYVVPQSGAQPFDIAELRCWLAERLSPPEMPRKFRVGERLPANVLGKPSDWDEC